MADRQSPAACGVAGVCGSLTTELTIRPDTMRIDAFAAISGFDDVVTIVKNGPTTIALERFFDT